ncbi:hypothetical protein ACU8KH_05781 [Lachancea thermotolerans]
MLTSSAGLQLVYSPQIGGYGIGCGSAVERFYKLMLILGCEAVGRSPY